MVEEESCCSGKENEPTPSSSESKVTDSSVSTQSLIDCTFQAPQAGSDNNVVKIKSAYKTTAQDQIRKEIDFINADLVGLLKRENCNQLSSGQKIKLKRLENKKKLLKKQLLSKISAQRRQRKFRSLRKTKLDELCSENPAIKNSLNLRTEPGRPRVEADQPELLKTIIEIAQYGSSAHNRRQDESLRSVRTLDQLCQELNKIGFHLSRSAVYLRLLPRRSDSKEGKISKIMHIQQTKSTFDH